MESKKIAETINVRINIGNFQHIEISKYAEKEITYNDKQEMTDKEDALTQELLENIIRNMRTIPSRLGKKTEAVQDVEDKIQKAIPEWMINNEEPNLAKKKNISGGAEVKANQEVQKKEIVTPKEPPKEMTLDIEEDLFN